MKDVILETMAKQWSPLIDVSKSIGLQLPQIDRQTMGFLKRRFNTHLFLPGMLETACRRCMVEQWFPRSTAVQDRAARGPRSLVTRGGACVVLIYCTSLLLYNTLTCI